MNPGGELLQSYRSETLKQFEDYLSYHGLHGLYNMIMQAPAGVAVFNGPDFTIEIINDTCLSFISKVRDDLTGKSLFATVPELKGQEIESFLQHVYTSGKPSYGNDFKISLMRGSRMEDVFFDFTCQPLRNKKEEVRGVIVIAYEVTSSVKAKYAVAESERQFRNMIMKSPIAMAIFRGKDFIIELANDELLKNIWQREFHEVQGKQLLEIFPELRDQPFPKLLQKVYETGTPYREKEAPAYISTKDGLLNKYYLDFDYSPLFEPDGKSVSGIMVTVINVTAQADARKKIEESEARYRHLIYGLPVAFYTCNKEGGIEIYNEAAVALWGRKPGPDNRWCGSYKIFKADGTPLGIDICPMALTIKTGKAVKGEEIIIERPDGKRLNVLPHPQPVIDEGGNITGGLNMLVDITERKIAERNTHHLAAIIQSSDDAIISKSLRGIITSWNPGAERLFGYTANEMIGKPINILIPPDRLAEEAEIMRRIGKGEQLKHFDSVRVTKEGRPIDVSLTISPIRDAERNITGVSTIARDITIQKDMDKILRESEQRLQMAVVAAELGAWEFNINTKRFTCNERSLEIAGFAAHEQPTTEQVIEHIYPDDIAIEEKAVQMIAATGQLDMEIRFVHGDKSLHWTRIRGKLLYDKMNQPERMIGTALDITLQKNAFEALKESELLFKTIANVSPVGLWLTDKEAGNSFVNDTWIEWTGIPLEEQYGKGWMKNVVPEDADRVRKKFLESMTLKESFKDEFRLVRKDGKMRWCLTEGYPYFNNEGEFEGYAGSVTDITERKMVEEELEKKVYERTQELKQANSTLEKSNSDLEQFAYVASHDLQEPLRKIKTFVSRLQEAEGKEEGKDKIYMEKIVSAAARMSTLIRDLLEYSKTGRVSEDHSLTDLNNVLETVKSDFELLIQQKKAIIQSGKLPVLYAVPHQMMQLFTNLLSNSLKFSKEDIPPVIKISSSRLAKDKVEEYQLDTAKKYSEIVFSDNGVGFSNEFSEKIFEIFQRLNPRSSYTGSGIGLSICRKIVSNHGGLIFAESAENEGTSFYIILPVEEENPATGNVPVIAGLSGAK